jgi:hypothetical protein
MLTCLREEVVKGGWTTNLGGSFDVLGVCSPETGLLRATGVLGVVGWRRHGCGAGVVLVTTVASLV